MIPDAYWQLGRRWLWLLILFMVMGAITAPFLLPSAIGAKSSPSHYSTATLAVSHYTSSSEGIVTPGERSDADDIVAGYAESLSLYAKTQQFYAAVQQDMAALGLTIHRQDVEAALKIEADPALFRINIQARDESRDVAGALAQAAVDVLVARAVADDSATAELLAADLEEEQLALLERLDALNTSSGPDTTPIALADVERSVINDQLRELTLQKEQLLSNRKDALTVVSGPDTVQSEASIVPTRDLILLGIALGLLLGWLAANVAERLLPRSSGTEPAYARQVAVVNAPAIDTRLHAHVSRPGRLGARRLRTIVDTSAEPPDEPQARD